MERLMMVEYIGKLDMATAEYNGKRYAFTRQKRLVIIPVSVYQNIMLSGAISAQDIIPYTSPEDQERLEAELTGKPAPEKDPGGDQGEGEADAPEPPEPKEVKEAKKKRKTRRKKGSKK